MFRYLLSLTLLVAICYGQEKPAESPQQPPSTQSNPSANPTPPKLQVRKSVRASYPLQAEEKGIQGQVIVRVLISETGDVETAEVVSGEKELTQSALEAVKKWQFEPYLVNGKAIKVRTNIPFDFYFSGNAKDVKDDPPPASTGPVRGEKAVDADKPLTPRVRVASGVVAGLLLHTVQPIYPPEAKAARVQGRVILHAIIDKDGRIKSLTVVSGPKELIQAATGAVEQWTYRPYLLEGKPIEVDTTIEVNFVLSWR
jgi:TonB family protein